MLPLPSEWFIHPMVHSFVARVMYFTVVDAPWGIHHGEPWCISMVTHGVCPWYSMVWVPWSTLWKNRAPSAVYSMVYSIGPMCPMGPMGAQWSSPSN